MKRAALLTHLLSAVAVVGAYASAFLPGGAPPWAAPLLALGTAGAIVSAMALGAAKEGHVGRLRGPFAAVFLVVAGGLLLLLALPPADPTEPTLILGLPLRAAILLYGIGLLPALLVPLAYALTFDELTLREEDLERVRAVARGGSEGEGSRGREDPAGAPDGRHGSGREGEPDGEGGTGLPGHGPGSGAPGEGIR